MCGITGFSGDLHDPEAARARLAAMCGALRHRGPDDDGQFVARHIALGMRRLSIIDVAGGHQPIANEDGAIVTVFNGEIYNHRELRAALEHAGHNFRTRSDSETLVHLYEDLGPGMLDRLRGMFAFAIWDARRERLFVARDRVGIKPLYYWMQPSGLAFASELRSFLAVPEFPREIDDHAIAEYLAFGYIPDPRSVFAAAHKLPPGHWLSWSRSEGMRIERYWTPVRADLQQVDEHELTAELERLLASAVRCHLESEVPLGAFLSGGIDSSTVVALMARELDRPVRTFAIGFDDPRFNEAPDAEAVAGALGTEHTTVIVRPEIDALIDAVVGVYDEPFGDSSALPTLVVSQVARQHVTVALSGDGGDELFGGYTRYLDVLRGWSVPGTPLRALLAAAVRRLPLGMLGRNWLLDRARTVRGRYASTVALPIDVSLGGVAHQALASDLGPMDALLDRWFDQAAGRDFVSQMGLVDLMSYLPGDILTKVDRASMAVSLEARVPLLDHTVVEFAAALPGRVRIRNGASKWLLRRAVERLVPPQVLAKRKQGFAIPLGAWLRRELRSRLVAVASAETVLRRWVDGSAVRRIVEEHLRERRDHSGLLWRLVVLERWLGALERGDLSRATALDASLFTVVGDTTIRA